ncbi:LmbE family N-acetylglucosaminyl deacetylase [Melghirimyces profundicolus]|uniref:LmbE family N-acetylglucosaminyl deacetylase n=1 Tax=Melghirimyces profundicolus TaxID=1242148 RepID=A0A2T6BUX9_9BACL|nr:PIG-L family deacetylase [Melghirimyces profundicolus]PTX59875.1 LmbE family N-acetylglucosaminyl deacetylase [Melghirimyces profundicolus]
MTKKLMFVFAHPDDETFATGGTIVRYARRPDCETVLFCATRGEAGHPGTPALCPKEQLGEVREKELAEAADVLGIDRVILRDYGDGRLREAPFDQLVGDVEARIRREKPDAVVTFPPHGISGHPDHQVIQHATREAVARLGNVHQPFLYYIVIPQSTGIIRAAHTTPDREITHRIPVAPWRREIMEALRCHRTQHLSVERVFPGVLDGDWQLLRTTEFYQSAGKANVISSTELI